MPNWMNRSCALWTIVISLSVPAIVAQGEVLWVEGEAPATSTMHRHPWWYDKVKRDQLSGGDFISNFDKDKEGQAEYVVTAGAAGPYEFWVRANPVKSSLSYRVNGGEWAAIDFSKELVDNENIAEDDKPDLRFIAWVKVGTLTLKPGKNRLRFKMSGENSNHGILDCFVLANEAFVPNGISKPGEKVAEEAGGWVPFNPKPDAFSPQSAIDLRYLNEKQAGDGGYIAAKGSQFVHSTTGEPVRFWAVNGCPGKDPAELRHSARVLAKYGVNLVRIHGGYFDANGNVDAAKIKHAIDIVEACKAVGIYSHFSIYFPIWMELKPGTPWLKGYKAGQKPFAALYFNPEFQEKYQQWWNALMTTPIDNGGHTLRDEPAVFGAEIINEDSYFFWTFLTGNIPDTQLKMLEGQFGEWVKNKYGSIESALAKWNAPKLPRDDAEAGRVTFRPLWEMANQRTERDKDTVAFLTQSQRGFYERQVTFLKGLGFKGVITASNWVTADPRIFGPLEKYTYLPGDFIDRHGYFGCNDKGEAAEWSVRAGHTYADRSALRFDPDEPGKPKAFVHPEMDPSYNDKPSMISETTFNRPNRYRSEAPLYYACYGALQDSDAIVHFAMDSAAWSTKPGYFVQPWTLMTPAMVGQFPAAAMIYRTGLITPGETVVNLNLKLADILDLQGTPLPQDASFDELRLKDVPSGTTIKPGNVIDPLVHFVGRTNVNITENGGAAALTDVSKYIDRAHQLVTSTNRQLKLDFGKGVLTINAPAAQGVSGNLHDAGAVDLADVSITSSLALAHIVAVSLDGKPLATSAKILLQAMSEEKPNGFETRPSGKGLTQIVKLGRDPWTIREIGGTVKFKRADAAQLKVMALDGNGDPEKEVGAASEIRLLPGTLYYLVTR